jgi:hypothetical protein
MAISEKEHFDALRDADQRAVELLAKANAARVSMALLLSSLLVSVVSVLVAIATIVIHKQ